MQEPPKEVVERKDLLDFVLMRIQNFLENLASKTPYTDPECPELVTAENKLKNELNNLKAQLEQLNNRFTQDPDRLSKKQYYDGLFESQAIAAQRKIGELRLSLIDVKAVVGYWPLSYVTQRISKYYEGLNNFFTEFNSKVMLLDTNSIKAKAKQDVDTLRREHGQAIDELRTQIQEIQANRVSSTELVVLQREVAVLRQQKESMNLAISQMWQHLPDNVKGLIEQGKLKGGMAMKANPDGSFEIGIKLEDYKKWPAPYTNKYLESYSPTPEFLKNDILFYLSAKAAFTYAMKPKVAVTAVLLYRYLLKITGELVVDGKSPKNAADYVAEKGKIDQLGKKFDLKAHIAACILYLFLEYDKTWSQVLKDPNNPVQHLASLANQYKLVKLTNKIKIIASSPVEAKVEEVVIGAQKDKAATVLPKMPDKAVEPEVGRGKYNSMKFASMFFEFNRHLKDERILAFAKSVYKRAQSNTETAYDANEAAPYYTVTPNK